MYVRTFTIRSFRRLSFFLRSSHSTKTKGPEGVELSPYRSERRIRSARSSPIVKTTTSRTLSPQRLPTLGDTNGSRDHRHFLPIVGSLFLSHLSLRARRRSVARTGRSLDILVRTYVVVGTTTRTLERPHAYVRWNGHTYVGTTTLVRTLERPHVHTLERPRSRLVVLFLSSPAVRV